MTDNKYDPYELYPEFRPKSPPPPLPTATTKPEPLPDTSELPEEFAKASMMAVKCIQDILGRRAPGR